MNRRLTGPVGVLRREWGVALSSVIVCSGCGSGDGIFSANDGGSRARGPSTCVVWWGGDLGEVSRVPYECRDNPDFSDLTGSELRALKTVLVAFCNNNKQATVVLNQSPNKGELVVRLDGFDNDCRRDQAYCADAPQVVQGQPDMLSKFAKCGGTEDGLRLLPVPEEAVRDALGAGALEETAGQADDGLVTLDSEGNVEKDPYRWFTRHMSCGYAEHTWMLPMGVHHVNRLFYNKDRIRALLGSDFEARLATMSLDDWLAWGIRLSESPGQPAFIAMPNAEEDAWVLSMLALENVRVALTKGVDHLPEETLIDEGAVADAVMARLEEIRFLATPDSSTSAALTASEALERVMAGEALFTVMGDWAYAGLDPESVGMVWFPSTSNVRVYAADGIAAFDLRGNGVMSNPQKGFVYAVNSSRMDFASAKGATEISQWMDVSLKECATNAGQAGCYVVPALSLDNGSWAGDRGAALQAWWVNPKADTEKEAKEALIPTPPSAAWSPLK